MQTLFAPLASTQGSNCTANNSSQSCPQVAGLVSVTNSAVLTANMGLLTGGIGSVKCPTGHGPNGECTKFSYPALYNDLFWQNRSLMIGVGGLASGFQNQQNKVSIYNATYDSTKTPTQIANQSGTGACNDTNASYWDIGVRGDTGPGKPSAGSLAPTYSVLTGQTSEVGTGSNDILAPGTIVGGTYCDGARVPLEALLAGTAKAWQTPPGTNESNALPAPPFTLMAGATVDEGNNWINLRWGPLSLNLTNGSGNPLFTFDPTLPAGSKAINAVPSSATTAYNAAPAKDFYGTDRKTDNKVDIGAVEYVAPPSLTVTPASLAFGNQVLSTTSAAKTLTLTSTYTSAVTINSITATASYKISATTCPNPGTLAANSSCTISVTFTPTATGATPGSVTISASVGVTNSPVALTGTGVAAFSATVSPSPLSFGNIPLNTAAVLNLTITSTGNQALTGGTFPNLAPPFTRITTGAFPGGAPNCGVTLAVGASCTIKVQYLPTTTTSTTKIFTIAYNNGAVVTGAPVTISGTGSATKATVSITPNPFSITIASTSFSGSGTVTLTNTAAVGGASVPVTGVAVTGSGVSLAGIWGFSAGTNTCTGALLPPGGTCTVQVNFTRIGAVGTHTGSISFTDGATGSPQSQTLTAIAQ